jgi:hypothetical protein
MTALAANEHPEVNFTSRKKLQRVYRQPTQKGKMQMCSPTIARKEMTATLVSHGVSPDLCCHQKDEAEFHPLHMDWGLIADTKGDPRPRMHWLTD